MIFVNNNNNIAGFVRSTDAREYRNAKKKIRLSPMSWEERASEGIRGKHSYIKAVKVPSCT